MSWDTIFQKRAEISEPDDFIKDFYKKYKIVYKCEEMIGEPETLSRI